MELLRKKNVIVTSMIIKRNRLNKSCFTQKNLNPVIISAIPVAKMMVLSLENSSFVSPI